MSQQIFLSHDSRDRKIAAVIAETVSRASLKQIVMWYSSDSSAFGGLKPGIWMNEIKSQLIASRAILTLLTPNSLSQPWMYFESGFGFYNLDCQVIPLCVGVSRSAVPYPLAIFQCYELNDYELLTQFCRKLFSQFQLTFDEEMASPILRTAADTIQSLTPVAGMDRSERSSEGLCDAYGQLDVCLAMLRKMFDDLPTMVHSIDETGVICEVNGRWLEVLGYEREEVIGKPADFLMTTDSAELAMLLIIPNFWKRGFCKDVPYRYKKKNGGTIDVLLNCVATTGRNGKRMSMSFVQDVSKSGRLRKLQKEKKTKYSQRLQDESAGFYETDIFGNFTSVNTWMGRVLGFARAEELVGKNFRDVVGSESARSIFRVLHSVFINRASKRGIVWRVETKNGRTITVESTVSLITAPSGKALGFRGVVRGISELSRLRRNSPGGLRMPRAHRDSA